MRCLLQPREKLNSNIQGEEKREDDLIDRFVNRAVLKIFDHYFQLDTLKPTVAYFQWVGA